MQILLKTRLFQSGVTQLNARESGDFHADCKPEGRAVFDGTVSLCFDPFEALLRSQRGLEVNVMIKPLTCPVCQRPTPPATGPEDADFPFCSARCRQIDLFRWADGRYAIVENLSDRPDLMEEALRKLEEEGDLPDEEASFD